jgi:antitoxin component YwqK of YwqJK toxin-antitoxin module
MKLNHIIFLLITALTVIACSNKKENNHARIIWDKYDNGNYKTVHQYFTDTADMTEDYYYQEFFENGNLKIQGLENQRTRKGEWKAYFENGDLKAKLTFENDVLNGPIKLYNDDGTVKAQDNAENGDLKQNNEDIKNFIMENFNISENRPNWNDSLDIMADSLKTILNIK